MRSKTVIFVFVLMFASALAAPAQAVPAGQFRVGAAKVDITPTREELPDVFLGVLDQLYSRAIVVDNGHTSSALVTLDARGIPNQLWKNITSRAEKELGIPAANILITATHSHSTPFALKQPGEAKPVLKISTDPKTLGQPAGPPEAVVNQRYEDNVFLSIKQAKEKLQPARISYGTGVSYINVQRDKIDPVTHRWWEGSNYDGLSDKTVAVIKFESMSGEPIALYYNYAMHAVITGSLDLVSGDAPGAASRYIENALDNKVVALWSEGASGDQNPIFFQQTFDLREIRVKDFAKRGVDISNSMPYGGVGLDRSNPEVARLMNEQKQMITSMGQMLGEEVLRVMREIKRPHADGRILGTATTITCPGRERTNEGRGGYPGTYKDGSPVTIGLSLVMIDDIAIGAVNGEVYNEIAQRLKRESPYAKTMMTTLTNGTAASGYIPDDASFGHYTFEVLSSRLQPGCAETSIVDGIIGMMPRLAY